VQFGAQVHPGTVPDLPQQAASYMGMPFLKTKTGILNENYLQYDWGQGQGNIKQTVNCQTTQMEHNK